MPPRPALAVLPSTVCAVLVLCAALVLVLIGTATIYSRLVPSPQQLALTLAQKEAAVALATRLRQYANRSVSPCDDFYEHVCGGWLARQDPMRDESTFDEIEQRIDAQLQALATAGWPLLSTWYQTCLAAEERARTGLAAMQELFSVIDSLQQGAANYTRIAAAVLGRLHRAGVSALFTAVVAQDARNSSRNCLYMDWAQTLVPLAVLRAPNTDDARALIAKLEAVMSSAIGADATRIAMAIEQQQLAPLMEDRDTYAQVAGPLSGLDWSLYWSELLGANNSSVVYSSGCVLIAQLYLGRALQLLTHNDAASLRAYLRMRVAAAVFDALPPTTLTPANAGSCLRSLRQWLAPVLGHYYAVQYSDDATRTAVSQMLGTVLRSFRTLLEQSSWMDAETRAAALRKLAAIRPLIAAPEHWSSVIPPDAVRVGQHLGNALRVLYALRTGELRSLWAVADRYTWLMAPYEVNAYYSPSANDIVFPEGILQSPVFNASAPLAANYGGLGSVMGHEVGHAFDNTGRLFDWDGNERDWWSSASAAAFEERAQCVVQLYDGLPACDCAAANGSAPIVVNGELTLGENWADLTGLSAAYEAYRMARAAQRPLDKRRKQSALVHAVFGYNEDQLFFRAWASQWCSHVVRAEAYELALDDAHAPARWRVNVPAMQNEDFRRAFGCSKESTIQQQCILF